MTNILIAFLPWIIAFFVNLLIPPAALFITGKLLKIENPNFKFLTCIWISLVASLLAGLAAGLNLILSFLIYILLLGYMIKTQFTLGKKQTIIIVIIMLLLSFGLNIGQNLLIKQLLLPPPTSPKIQVTQETKVEKVDPEFDICSVLNNEKAKEITGLDIKSESSGYYKCDYIANNTMYYFYISLSTENLAESKKLSYELQSEIPNYIITPLDQIQSGAYLVSSQSVQNIYFDYDNKHLILGRSTMSIDEKKLIPLFTAIITGENQLSTNKQHNKNNRVKY